MRPPLARTKIGPVVRLRRAKVERMLPADSILQIQSPATPTLM
jgi:hypothetical protein